MCMTNSVPMNNSTLDMCSLHSHIEHPERPLVHKGVYLQTVSAAIISLAVNQYCCLFGKYLLE